jgi:xanthosine utilization system XapX-like protein
MAAIAQSSVRLAIPAPRTIANLMIGGLVGLLVWEVWARVITKAVLGYPLEPAGLIDALFQHNLGLSVPWLAREALHYAVGIVGYPVAYYLISRVVPRWGLVLDAIVFLTFSYSIYAFAAAGKLTPLHFIFYTVVLSLLASRFLNRSPLAADVISWGNFTWFNALGLMAPLGGLSFYLLGEGGDLSYMSFFGHVVYGALAALVFEKLEARGR